MRTKFRFSNSNDGMIGFDYQYKLASLIYKKLEENSPELAKKEHSKFGSKIYTFSGFKSKQSEVVEKGIIFHNGYFILSSPDKELIKNTTESFLDNPKFEVIGGGSFAKFEMEGAEIIKEPKISSRCTFRTLSPIYVKTIRGEGKNKREIDLFPNEPKFYERLHVNLVKKFELFYGADPVDHFDVLRVYDTKTKRISIGRDYRRCSLMSLTLEGSPELLKFAYDAGLGEKTAMGFGCLDIL